MEWYYITQELIGWWWRWQGTLGTTGKGSTTQHCTQRTRCKPLKPPSTQRWRTERNYTTRLDRDIFGTIVVQPLSRKHFAKPIFTVLHQLHWNVHLVQLYSCATNVLIVPCALNGNKHTHNLPHFSIRYLVFSIPSDFQYKWLISF